MSNKMPASKRKYTVFIGAPKDGFISEEIYLRNILEPKGKDGEDWEYIYALGNVIDEVMDLKPLDYLYFQANRDNKEDRGLIVRKQ